MFSPIEWRVIITENMRDSHAHRVYLFTSINNAIHLNLAIIHFNQNIQLFRIIKSK